MSGTLNGRVVADSHNSYRAIEVARMPAGEQEAFAVAFHREVATPLGLVIGDPEHTRAWTVGRRIWLAFWEREMLARAAARRAEMDGKVVSLDQDAQRTMREGQA